MSFKLGHVSIPKRRIALPLFLFCAYDSSVLQNLSHTSPQVENTSNQIIFWNFSDPIVEVNAVVRHLRQPWVLKIYAPSSSLLQGKYLPFSPSPLRLNIFRLFVILSLTQIYRYTPEIFLFSTATFKHTYRALLRRIGVK
jgi:hypothetical protein